jgi:hypothetical protein
MEGEKYEIKDITSTEYILVDSIDKVKKVSEDLCSGTLGKDLDFLLDWERFSESEKHRKYNEFQCHEMNLFLYFKDYDYFMTVARPFINSKMEKTFIDHWLLQDHEKIIHYHEISKFEELNALEQSLLVFSLINHDKEKARILVERIRLGSEAESKHSVETKNRMFDTVLSLNLASKGCQKIRAAIQREMR